nr:NADH dehydrogenase subunit 4 [Myxine glutinosa]
MLKTIFSLIAIIPMTLSFKKQFFWTAFISSSFLMPFLFFIFTPLSFNSSFLMHLQNKLFGYDMISAPLVFLSLWMLPLMALASQHHMKKSPLSYQLLYITILIIMQTLLILTFLSTNLMNFYILFESSLIPILLIIFRWGNQKERINAGIYLLFYTLIGSLPLLASLLFLSNTLSTLYIPILMMESSEMYHSPILWLGCFSALLIKTPLYGFHLWLPKAHVEATIAGSMTLAALMLKLGGYGMIRLSLMPFLHSPKLSLILISIALWGAVMTSFICLRQTDLKALIAYSSVSHMGLMTASIMTLSLWGMSGAFIMMIAHGLSSSALFFLANSNYEKTNTRTIILLRHTQMLLPLTSLWWLFIILTNLAMPPSINFISEITIMSSLFLWSPLTFPFLALTMVITTTYSMSMFMLAQGKLSKMTKILSPFSTREHLTLFLHLFPMIAIMAYPNMIINIFC